MGVPAGRLFTTDIESWATAVVTRDKDRRRFIAFRESAYGI